MINLFCKIMLQKVSIHSMVKLFSCEKKFCHIFVDLMSISSCPTLPSQDHFLFKFNFLKCQNYNSQMQTSHFESGRKQKSNTFRIQHLSCFRAEVFFRPTWPRVKSTRPRLPLHCLQSVTGASFAAIASPAMAGVTTISLLWK